MGKADPAIKAELDELAKQADEMAKDFGSIETEALSTFTDNLKSASTTEIANIEKIKAVYYEGQDGQAYINSITPALNDLVGLIKISKKISETLFVQLSSFDVQDPKLIEAAAEFIRSTRETISEVMAVYREEQAFIHKVKLSILNFAQRKELIKYKHELDMSKQGDPDASDLDGEGLVHYSQEKIARMILPDASGV